MFYVLIFSRCFALLVLLLVSGLSASYGRSCTAVCSCNWNAGATWSCGSAPASNDTLTIPAGVTVSVNCNCGSYDNMVIHVYGTLYFNNGQKITMTCNGKVYVHARGTVDGDNPGSKIIICGDDVYNGGMGPVYGPSLIDQNGIQSTLPIELLSFSVNMNRDGQAEVSWVTATETNNDYFTIERTLDAVNYEVVTTVDGAGTTSAMREYFAIDPSPHQGTSYYRLKQTDFDGAFKYFDLVPLENNDSELGLHIYPNPATPSDLTIQVSGKKEEEILVVVTDLLGRESYSKVVIVNGGRYKIVLDPGSKLAPGLYMVIASSHNNRLQSRKIVVK